MGGDIQWIDPPESRTSDRRGTVSKFVVALQERPGQWALYPFPASQNSATANTKRFPGTQWTRRIRADGKYDVYARWIGASTPDELDEAQH